MANKIIAGHKLTVRQDCQDGGNPRRGFSVWMPAVELQSHDNRCIRIDAKDDHLYQMSQITKESA